MTSVTDCIAPYTAKTFHFVAHLILKCILMWEISKHRGWTIIAGVNFSVISIKILCNKFQQFHTREGLTVPWLRLKYKAGTNNDKFLPTLRRTCTSNQNWACFVNYLKSVHTFEHPEANYLRNFRIIVSVQAVLELLTKVCKILFWWITPELLAY